MAFFKRKPLIIEAEQYLIDGPVPKGCKITYPEIIFSLYGHYFYLTHCNPREWLSIEKHEGNMYDAKPFACWSVKSGDRKLACQEPELAKLYVEIFGLKQPVPYAYVETMHKGQKVTLADGDWVLPEPDGIHYNTCKPDVFANTYQQVTTAFGEDEIILN